MSRTFFSTSMFSYNQNQIMEILKKQESGLKTKILVAVTIFRIPFFIIGNQNTVVWRNLNPNCVLKPNHAFLKFITKVTNKKMIKFS
jgi:hypothetical protein